MRTSKELQITRNLKFGLEIEFNNYDAISEIVRISNDKGVRCVEMGYTHQVTEGFWKIVRDGSCGYEVVSPILYGEDGLNQLKVICEAMNQAGAKVDKRCGVHVHHDANDFEVEDFKNVYRMYNKYSKALDSMMPLSRRGSTNMYCQDVNTRWLGLAESCNSIEDMKRVLADNDRRAVPHRYHKLNFCSYIGYGTLEFRHHSGSTDYGKLSNWVLLTHMMMQRGKGKKIKPVTDARQVKWDESELHMMYDFYMELGVSGTELASYVRNRRGDFKNLNGVA